MEEDLGVYVVVQFYPWFKFYFSLFQTHYHTLMTEYCKIALTLEFVDETP